MLTPAMLARLYPHAPAAARDALARAHDALASAGLLQPGWRMPFFLAQLGHESAGLTRTTENLTYTRPETLVAVWPKRFRTIEDARPFVRNPSALAEKVYGGRADLGNTKPGDGARYVGRGYLQVTGRANYREIGALIGFDLEAEPDCAAEPDTAVKIACAFWTARRLNALCDTGRFFDVSRRVNGGSTGYDDRCIWLEKARTATDWPLTPACPALDLTP